VRRGIGLAACYYGVGLGALGKHLNPAGASVVVAADGSVSVAVGTTEIGQGMITVLSQITAEALGCPMELVKVVDPDTSRVPDSGPTVASRTTVMSGNAIRDAAGKIRVAMQPVIADSGLGWREAVALCVQQQVGLAAHGWSVPPATTFDLETGQGDAYICYTFSANVVELEVDTETGETRVLRVHSGHDLGKAVNPTTAEGQVEGGVVQGLGYALVEEHALQDGRILNDQFSTYIIPTPLDTPEIHPILVEHEYPWGPYGAKGLGETPIIAVAPAVTAAIRHAVGVHLDELPATPERVWQALRTRHDG
jgi:CO/xanthine dehydrogenase Mo-binding subunit